MAYILRLFLAFQISVIMFWISYRKRSLSLSGATAGIFVGVLMICSNYCFMVALLTFFITGSLTTRLKASVKQQMEEDYRVGGQRTWVQVVANAGVATLSSALYLIDLPQPHEHSLHMFASHEAPIDFVTYPRATFLAVVTVAVIAGSCGDTYASELGSVYSFFEPRLITAPWRRVPRGTNGGVSVTGTLASGLGGLIVGISYYLSLLLCHSAIFTNGKGIHAWRWHGFDVEGNVTLAPSLLESSRPPQWSICMVGLVAGFFSSFVDSILGATLQFSGLCSKTGRIVSSPGPGVRHISGRNWLDNHQVNLVSSIITALVVPTAYYYCWPYIVGL